MATVRDPGRIILTALSVVLSSTIGFGQTLPPLRGVYPLGMNSINAGVTPESGFTYSNLFLFYSRNLLKGANGEVVSTGNNSVLMDLNTFVWVSQKEILGGVRLSLTATLLINNNSLILSILSELAEKKSSLPLPPESNRTWCWEGHVQDRIIEYLRSQGYVITSTADTHTRESGKDIQAKSTQGTVLWITVKGYPTKSSYTQARHWFAELLFDLILYRSENIHAQLGVGLPDGFTTYRNLATRVDWFRRSLPFQFYWVHEDGTVTIE